MKWLIICWIGIFLSATCERPTSIKNKNLPVALSNQPLLNFKKEIEPIFINRCSPCHFSGGTMYSRMPFDKDTTILKHSRGILKRIKDEKDNKLLEAFINQNSPK